MEGGSTILELENQFLEKFSSDRNSSYPETKITFRKLQSDDFSRGYYDVLSNLTTTGDVTQSQFEEQFSRIDPQNSETYKIIVGVDEATDRIVTNGTLLIEQKFIRECAACGHIEDIVVHKDYGKQGLGRDVLQVIKELAKINKCYKVILDCSDGYKGFYEKNDFEQKGVQMAKYNPEEED
ncbi:unnamed protein product [Moneuplotes crassus]|uniref:Glucosamine 6-phosphate N-acetyltransferase n=1 Tax=Euplotes crassus TaxID=5936 RepID=A0AAD1Y0H4_EUPCR|nr:unnamed protein product [Moneuplotes crassus]